VLILMTWDDNLVYAEQAPKENKAGLQNLASLFHTWQQLKFLIHKPQLPDFSRSVNEVHELSEEVREDGGRLIAVIDRNDLDYGGHTERGKIWNQLTRTLITSLNDRNPPVIDLGRSLYEGNNSQVQLQVYPGFDDSPNERANDLDARALFGFLIKNNVFSTQ
jgi:hypothetical protein